MIFVFKSNQTRHLHHPAAVNFPLQPEARCVTLRGGDRP
jgi:hypothetical protein